MSCTQLATLVGLALATIASISADPVGVSVSSSLSSKGLGCQAMCCDGKNNTCHSRGLRVNGQGSASSLCFCDEGCPAMGDCCFDYELACTVVNCEMSDWSEYSECSSSCGRGTKSRHRTIVVEPRFGGTACPQNLNETTICSGSSCEKAQAKPLEEVEKETAKIMPASFGRFRNLRRYNANMDIRKNLYYQYYYKKKNTHSGYCSRFRVISSRRACRSYSVPWANVLRPGAIICVECQQTAMEKGNSNGMCAGHGEVGVNTNWNAVNAPGCTGWWERQEDAQGCDCGQTSRRGSKEFIFV